MIVEEVNRHTVECVAEQGRDDTDIWHQMVFGLLRCEEPEHKQPEQGTIGVACQDIDGVNQRGGVELSEQKDEENEEQTHDDVRSFPEFLITRFSSYIYTIAGCQ